MGRKLFCALCFVLCALCFVPCEDEESLLQPKRHLRLNKAPSTNNKALRRRHTKHKEQRTKHAPKAHQAPPHRSLGTSFASHADGDKSADHSGSRPTIWATRISRRAAAIIHNE
jgi:hypothetical protein